MGGNFCSKVTYPLYKGKPQVNGEFSPKSNKCIRDSYLMHTDWFLLGTWWFGNTLYIFVWRPRNRLLIFCPHIEYFFIFCDIDQNGPILGKYCQYIGNITQYLPHFGEICTLMVYSRDPTGRGIDGTTTTYPWKERCNFGL